jgi:hypothetical protein
MVFPAIGEEVYEDFLKARANNGQSPLGREEFEALLEHWYAEYQASECSLGYAAEQLGLYQIDFIYLLDALGWKVTNL